jgi:Peptidase propeptide and YPEB domain
MKSGCRVATLAAVATFAQPLPHALAKRHIGLMAEAKASRSKAARTALRQVPKGKIKFTELELAHGRLVWCFDISMRKTKNITEIEVDAKTGEIVSSQVQTPQDHLRDEAAEIADRQTRVIYRSR